MTDQPRWMLAYDATCATCRRISRVVGAACDKRLLVVPLGRADVRDWRTRALGEHAVWAPTLLRVDDAGVRAWAGAGMALPLVRRLGLRTTARVVWALGRVRVADTPPDPGQPARRTAIGPLVQLLAGAGTAARLLLTGKAPVAAAGENAAAQRWVERNKDRLPQGYAEVTAYPEAYQRAIYAASPPAAQSRFWVEALRRDRLGHADLTAEQREVFDRAIGLAATESLFLPDQRQATELDESLAGLRQDAVRVFPDRKDHHLLVTLGKIRPAQGASPQNS